MKFNRIQSTALGQNRSSVFVGPAVNICESMQESVLFMEINGGEICQATFKTMCKINGDDRLQELSSLGFEKVQDSYENPGTGYGVSYTSPIYPNHTITYFETITGIKVLYEFNITKSRR